MSDHDHAKDEDNPRAQMRSFLSLGLVLVALGGLVSGGAANAGSAGWMIVGLVVIMLGALLMLIFVVAVGVQLGLKVVAFDAARSEKGG